MRVTQFRQFPEKHTRHQALLMPELRSKVRMLENGRSEAIQHIELLEDGVKCITPIDLCFLRLSVCVV